jgi:enoyl-[acyl-carrier-protein] reductase (NADH)
MEDIYKEFEVIKSKAADFCSFNEDAVNPEKIKQIIGELERKIGTEGSIKAVVHSIAKGSLKPMGPEAGTNLSASDIEITFKAMALSLYDWVQNILLSKLNHQDMRVISFTSEGNTKVMPGYGAVSVAKVALEALTRSMAVEFASLGIKANCIQAGVTETASFTMIPNSDQIKAFAQKRNPSGRITMPEDVANTVYLLCSDEAKWITGNIIKADGGESLR